MRPQTRLDWLAFTFLIIGAFSWGYFVTDVNILDVLLERIWDPLDDVVTVLIALSGGYWVWRISGSGREVVTVDDRNKTQDFWEWAFEQTGTNPLGWQHSARDLIEAAGAVKARVQNLGPGLMHSLAGVQAMLLGMALESLLKGMWIKKHKAWQNPEKGLTYGGKKPRILGVGDHELKQLAHAAEVKVSTEEASVLQRLSAFVKFAGRYPIPTTPEQMKPSRTGTAPGFISAPELTLAEQLAARLMKEIEPWR